MERLSNFVTDRMSVRGRNLLSMVFFGVLSLLIGAIQFQIPGVDGGVSDLREVAVLSSVLYLTHWAYGLGVALITAFSTPADGSFFSTFAMHACGVTAAWFFYREARVRLKSDLAFGLAILGFNLIYYLVILVPVMVVTNAAAGLIEVGDIFGTYLEVLSALPFEIVATAGITTLYAVAYRLREDRRKVLENAYDATLEGWAGALELRDRETSGHSRRVAKVTVRLGRAFDLSDRQLADLRRGALLHDIGKMGVPESILRKSAPLTDDEEEIIREHPDHARRLLEPIGFLHPAMDIPYSHHERWDGSGYPRGLAGEEIPFAARLFAVIDVWDALAFDRPYRAKWSHEQIVQHLREGAGTLFDPRIVKVFLEEVVGDEKP